MRVHVAAEHTLLRAALEDRGQHADHAGVALLDRGQPRDVAPLVHVLDADQADEERMHLVVVERDLDDAPDRLGRIGVFDAFVAVERADLRVGLLQHRAVQPFLALEVVVDHPLRGARALGDRVDARPAQAMGRELLGRHGQDVGLRALGIVGEFVSRSLGRGFLLSASHPRILFTRSAGRAVRSATVHHNGAGRESCVRGRQAAGS